MQNTIQQVTPKIGAKTNI